MSNDILDISLWPNSEGILGVNKVAIPDGVTTQWPEGDALVENFVYKDGKLVGLVDNKALEENDSKSTVIPYDFVDITVNKRLETLMTFNAGERCKHLNINYEIYLPKGYKRLEYLESTNTQFIYAPYDMTVNTGWQFKYQLMGRTNRWNFASIVRITDESGGMLFSLHGGRDGTNNELAHGVYVKPTSIRPVVRGTDIDLSTFELQYNYKNGKTISISADGNTSSKSIIDITPYLDQLKHIAVFGQVQVTTGKFSASPYTRCFGGDISEGEAIRHCIIPALGPTGAPCLYDIISQEPFYNDGTGDFLYPGAESQVVTSDMDEIFYAKKTAHGIQKLYHVPENYNGTKDDYASENGFKELVEPPMPSEGYWSPEWTETDTQLICNWIETEAPIEA